MSLDLADMFFKVIPIVWCGGLHYAIWKLTKAHWALIDANMRAPVELWPHVRLAAEHNGGAKGTLQGILIVIALYGAAAIIWKIVPYLLYLHHGG